ncbi:MAG: CBS domain-containing protein [Anaerolineae bacterium]|nr:CBS domain-containing protein [Anaerolineae bacterium]
MLLILTHENADFDAVAAQLAAHKLHPEGIPLLSRRVNRNVRQFLALYWDSLPHMRPEEWQRQRVEQVILVDTQAVPGIRGMRQDTPVRLIDHHSPEGIDPAWDAHVEQVGATTTLLVERLRERGRTLSTVEATLLLLGIYEDTGSLTYGTTTARDARAAAWLLEQKADLATVRRFLDIPLSDAQQELYDRLQQGIDWQRVEGRAIALAETTAPDDFDDEISAVAHRLRDALNPDGLIVLVKLPQHVQLVARSTTDGVDVSAIARALGGGGHGRAAAATIMDLSLAEASVRVRELLPAAVEPMMRVAEIMSRGVQTLPLGTTVAAAAEQMQRFGHEGYPIVDPETGRLAGLLTRRAVDRAMRHDLGRLDVGQVMKSGHVTVHPFDSVERVQQLMIEEDWGQIPVVAPPSDEGDGREAAEERLIGIVTRTDLLRLLGKAAGEEGEENMRPRLASGLPAPVWALVQQVSEVAAEMAMPIYFVGGLVRDLLLDLPATDVDIVVEGDAIALAQELRSRYGGRVRSHSRFGTAKWLLSRQAWRRLAPGPDLEEAPATIDFVTARTEFYERPSALPEVERGSIKLDLHRRDFTINTLAIRLDGAHLGQLLDFYGGMRDLDRGLIRVLHSLSFIDDPTRIVRAVRLEQRLGFTIEARTQELIAGALPMLGRVTGDRIRHEIELALRESAPGPVLQRLAELDVLSEIHPELSWDGESAGPFAALRRLMADPLWHAALQGESPASVYFALWLAPLPEAVREAVMKRLKVRRSTRDEVDGLVAIQERLSALPAEPAPSEVEQVVRPFNSQPRILLAARAALAGSPAGDRLDRYQREWRHVETVLDGNNLRALGLKPGPLYAVLLDHLLAARLDGEVSSEAEERALLARLLESEGDGETPVSRSES